MREYACILSVETGEPWRSQKRRNYLVLLSRTMSS